MDTETKDFDAMTLDCPSRVIMQRLGDQWTPLLFLAPNGGPRRFSQVRNDVGGVVPKVPTQTLRTLERDGLLNRTICPEVPPRVEYEPTELGYTVLGPLEIIRAWSQDRASLILQARDDYAERHDAWTPSVSKAETGTTPLGAALGRVIGAIAGEIHKETASTCFSGSGSRRPDAGPGRAPRDGPAGLV